MEYFWGGPHRRGRHDGVRRPVGRCLTGRCLCSCSSARAGVLLERSLRRLACPTGSRASTWTHGRIASAPIASSPSAAALP